MQEGRRRFCNHRCTQIFTDYLGVLFLCVFDLDGEGFGDVETF